MFDIGEIDLKRRVVGSSLERRVAFPFVRQEVIHRGQKKRPELSQLRIELLQRAAFEQADEEPLSEIARGLHVISAPPHVRVQRVPIARAEPFERRAGFFAAGSGGKNDAPASVLETVGHRGAKLP